MRKRSFVRSKFSFLIALGAAAPMMGHARPAGPQPLPMTVALTEENALSRNPSLSISIGGTGSALGTMQKLADEFRKSHPKVRIKIFPTLGSSGGIQALMAGQLSLSVSSRPITEAERANGIVSKELARTPFVFATGLNTPVANVTLDQLAALYSGKTRTWSDGTQVRLVLRPAIDTDTKLVKAMSPELENALLIAYQRPGRNIAITDTDSADDLGRIPGALGTSTLALIKSESRVLNVLSVAGVQPSIQNLANRTYPYQKSIYLITTSTPSAVTHAFTTFAHSAAGAAILTETGSLPTASAK